jgi:metal-responsive CopG/Arc/MetJ family transcriptional regulator
MQSKPLLTVINAMKFQPVSISLDADSNKRLNRVLEALGMTRSEYVRDLIRQDTAKRPTPKKRGGKAK